MAPGGVLTYGAALDTIMSRAGLRATWATLETATISSAVALVLGATLALVLAATDVRGRQRLTFLFVLSMLISPQVAAVAYLSLVGPASPLLNTLGLAPEPGSMNPLLGRDGISLVLGLHHAPLVFIILMAGLKRIPRSLVEAARIDRASPWTITRTILVPLLKPHLINAALLAFVAGVGNFGIAAVLGLPVNYVTLPTLIYRRLSSFGPTVIGDAAVLGTAVAVIAGIGVLAARFAARQASVHLEDEARLEPFWCLKRWRLPVEVILWTLISVVLLLPGAGLFAAALVPSYGVPLSTSTVTLDNFTEVLLRQQGTARAFGNSLFFAAGSAFVLACLAIPMSYVLARRSPRMSRPLLALIEMPYALPGVVLAVAFILLFLKPLPLVGVSLYATPWIILLAYIARFLPVALKPALAAMEQFDPAQEEAAALDGARILRRLRDIIAPSLFTSVAAGGLLVFLLAFSELTVSSLLWSTGTETVGVILFSLEEAGLASQAAAVGVITALVVTATMLALNAMSAHLPEGVLPWRT
ncbi:ABC transporter permease [Microvirga aerophila]|uniref:ABC transporter permease n=1 Tax=Microvirga aerophila TaxID=670291 RepID=UPI001FDF5A97|nr:iron ABC transporter permease [Microvirga aerophila]